MLASLKCCAWLAGLVLASPCFAAMQPAADGFGAVRNAYRNTIAERITVEIQGSGADSGTAGMVWSVEWTDGVPVARIDLGRLQIEIAGGTLSAVHRHNPKTVFRLTLDAINPMGSIESALPPLPLPQLAWAIAPGSDGPDLSALLPGLLAMPAGSLASVDGSSFRATMSNGWMATASRRTDVTGGLALLTLDAADGSRRLAISSVLLAAPLPRLMLKDREDVGSLVELKAAPADIPVGSTLPTPGLMTRQYEPWSLGETLATAKDAGITPIFGVLVLFDASRPASIEVAAAAHRATVEAVRSLRRRAKFGELDSGVMVVRPVAVLPVDLFLEKPISAALERWRREAGDKVDPVWSSAGPTFVSRLIPGASAAIVIVDESQRVLQSIPLDARQLESDAIQDEVEAALAAKLQPIELP